MITYILGNSIRKRAQFSKINNDEELYLDDMRISCDVVRNGTYYFATEGRPFKNMRVGDYVGYSRSLFDAEAKDVKRVKRLLKSVGYKGLLGKKLSRVSDCDYLRILLAARLKETTKALYFNLDAWKYSVKNEKRMRSLFAGLPDYSVFALVSDIRFCGDGDDVMYLTSGRDLVLLDPDCKRKRTSRRKIFSILKAESIGGENA